MTMPMNQDFMSLIIDIIKDNITLQQLDLKDTNISYKDKKGRNALYFAIKTRNITNAKLLIESGIPLMVAPKTHALFHSICCNDFETMKFLIEKGIDINIKDTEYKTPLIKAVSLNRVKMVKYLLEQGADIFKMDVKYDMAIDFAYLIGSKKLVNILYYHMRED
jgi:ankyrin repeat protein